MWLSQLYSSLLEAIASILSCRRQSFSPIFSKKSLVRLLTEILLSLSVFFFSDENNTDLWLITVFTFYRFIKPFYYSSVNQLFSVFFSSHENNTDLCSITVFIFYRFMIMLPTRLSFEQNRYFFHLMKIIPICVR